MTPSSHFFLSLITACYRTFWRFFSLLPECLWKCPKQVCPIWQCTPPDVEWSCCRVRASLPPRCRNGSQIEVHCRPRTSLALTVRQAHPVWRRVLRQPGQEQKTLGFGDFQNQSQRHSARHKWILNHVHCSLTLMLKEFAINFQQRCSLFASPGQECCTGSNI